MDSMFDLVPRLVRLFKALAEVMHSPMPCIPLAGPGVSKALVRPLLRVEIVRVFPTVPYLARVGTVDDVEVIHVSRSGITIMAVSSPDDPEYDRFTLSACSTLVNIMETVLTVCRVYRVLEENRHRCSSRRTIEMLEEMCSSCREILSMASRIARGLTDDDIYEYIDRLKMDGIPSAVKVEHLPLWHHGDGVNDVIAAMDIAADDIHVYSDYEVLSIHIPSTLREISVAVYTSMDTAVSALRRAIDLTIDALRYVIAMKTAVQLWLETSS